MENIGIDVHKRESQLRIIREEGEVVELRIRTERGRFAEVLGGRGRAKVLLEASTESEWVARCLEELGHEVVVADPNFAPTAAAFVATIDDPKRFKGPHQAEAYLGLVPGEMSSGEKQRRGHITKTGNTRMRSLLVQVALSTMRLRKASTEHLWEWVARLELKRGRKVAAVALARKVTGILYAMMRDGSEYKPPVRKEVCDAAA